MNYWEGGGGAKGMLAHTLKLFGGGGWPPCPLLFLCLCNVNAFVGLFCGCDRFVCDVKARPMTTYVGNTCSHGSHMAATDAKQAHNVEMTLYGRRCDVMTSLLLLSVHGKHLRSCRDGQLT